MALDRTFTNAVLVASKAREAKIVAVAEGVDWFLGRAIGFWKAGRTDLTHVVYNGGIDSRHPDTILLVYKATEANETSTEINICVMSSGFVSISFSGHDYATVRDAERIVAALKGGEPDAVPMTERKFDMDGLAAADAVAKILAVIQFEDLSDFGPLVLKTKRLMESERQAQESARRRRPSPPR